MEKERSNDNTPGEDKDIKPLLDVSPIMNGLGPSNIKKWLPGSWQDATRKSAFQPYKQTPLCTVLTNLQRGNTQAETPVPQPKDINFHTRAGQGEITEEDINNEKCVDICDSNGLTALHWAAAYGQINSVQLLLKNGAVLDKLGPEHETPLLLAANGGHHDVVRLLLSKGADVNHTDDVRQINLHKNHSKLFFLKKRSATQH